MYVGSAWWVGPIYLLLVLTILLMPHGDLLFAFSYMAMMGRYLEDELGR